jgi:predicted nucleic-acid-binding Zn-ribbon protein
MSARPICHVPEHTSMKKTRFPPMVVDLVQAALSACDGVEFSDLAACPSCGGAVQGYDTRKKQFAVITENEQKKIIEVRVKRFYCKSCTRYWYADEPFYPDTRMGSPLIDLCKTFAKTIPFSRTATSLSRLGIAIDRSSVRNYARTDFGEITTADIFNIQLPFSIIRLSSLAASAGERSGITGADVLAACGFPSAHPATHHLPSLGKDPEQRQEEKEETGHL